ncbi:MAG: 6-bladed beta-propeller [bacterium]
MSKLQYLSLLLLILFIISCSQNNSSENENIDRTEESKLFWDCENLAALEPYKFNDLASSGDPLTFEPMYIKYDSFRDRLLVLDGAKYKLLIISPEGELLKEIGQQGEAVSEFSSPGHFDYDQDGNIFILDNNKVEVYDSLGNERRSFVPDHLPWRILVEDNSLFILTDFYFTGKVLARYSLSGELFNEYIDKIEVDCSDLEEKKVLEMLVNESEFTKDSEGNIYVGFISEYRIVKVDTGGNINYSYITRELPFDLIKPHWSKDTSDRCLNRIVEDISIDENDYLYILWGENFGEPNCRVDVFDNRGELIDVLKLAVPSTGQQFRRFYRSPIMDIEVHGQYLYASESYTDGLIYRYRIK